MSGIKKYGLVLPGKDKTRPLTFQASRNVFGNDSDSDDEARKKPVLLRPSHNINRQTKISQEKAIEEDPTVYQYDEIYDSMASKKEEEKSKGKEEKKPRYIENLLKAASKRKVENERRIERQIQKEREKEGDEFADKEVFVTSAYKKKLEEMKLEEEKEKREEYLESIGDVTKQKDLGGFYRHLYEQRLGSDKNKDDEEANKAPDNIQTQNNEGVKTPEKQETHKKRNYRKRKSSADLKKNLSEGEIDDSDEEINRLNITDIREAKRTKNYAELDADSDFSVDDPSDEDDVESKESVKKLPEDTPKSPLSNETFKEPAPKAESKDTETKRKKSKESKDEPVPAPTPKIDIWKKRTVGEAFDQAVKRYYERKAARGL